MNSSKNNLSRELKLFFEPILSTSTDVNGLVHFFSKMGWNINAATGIALGKLQDVISVVDVAVNSADFWENLSTDQISDLIEALSNARELFLSLSKTIWYCWEPILCTSRLL